MVFGKISSCPLVAAAWLVGGGALLTGGVAGGGAALLFGLSGTLVPRVGGAVSVLGGAGLAGLGPAPRPSAPPAHRTVARTPPAVGAGLAVVVLLVGADGGVGGGADPLGPAAATRPALPRHHCHTPLLVTTTNK